eukprot:g59.t1
MKLVIAFAVAVASHAALRGSMEDRMKALEAQVSNMKASAAGELKIFVDGRTVCPEGTAEPNVTRGMVLVGRPKDGTTGATFNRPFDAGEGHVHANGIDDPGHDHHYSFDMQDIRDGDGGTVQYVHQDGPDSGADTQDSFTGITISNAAAKSNIEVSIDANDAGEHYPLVYVLICQVLP